MLAITIFLGHLHRVFPYINKAPVPFEKNNSANKYKNRIIRSFRQFCFSFFLFFHVYSAVFLEKWYGTIRIREYCLKQQQQQMILRLLCSKAMPEPAVSLFGLTYYYIIQYKISIAYPPCISMTHHIRFLCSFLIV